MAVSIQASGLSKRPWRTVHSACQYTSVWNEKFIEQWWSGDGPLVKIISQNMKIPLPHLLRRKVLNFGLGRQNCTPWWMIRKWYLNFQTQRTLPEVWGCFDNQWRRCVWGLSSRTWHMADCKQITVSFFQKLNEVFGWCLFLLKSNFCWAEFVKWLPELCDGYYIENKVYITNAFEN